MSNIIMYAHGFGHPLVCNNNVWMMCDTGEIWNDEVLKNLTCPRCGLKPTEEGHDPCIANLPDVDFACCGHGLDADIIGYQLAYIKYSDGTIIRFDTTDDLLKHVGKL